MMKKCNIKKSIDAIFVLSSFLLIILYLLPYFVWGEDNYITTNDNLDHLPAIMKVLKKHGLFNLGEPTGIMDNTSSLFFFGWSISLLHLLYYFFSPYWAYVLNISIGVLVGFVSMYYLELKLFRLKHSASLLLVAALYSILPTIPVWTIPMGCFPLMVLLLISLHEKEYQYHWHIVLCFVIAFFLDFVLQDLFICAFLALAVIYFSIKQNTLNKKWSLAFVAYTSGVVLFNIKLFYLQLFSGIDLNRAHFIIAGREGFYNLFSEYFFIGYGEVRHKIKIFMPLFFLFFLVCLIRIAKTWIEEKRMALPYKEMKIFLLCFTLHFICAILAAADGAGMFEPFKSYITVLKGFSFDRLYGFNRILGYLSIAAVIMYISKVKNGKYYVLGLLVLLVHTFKVYTSIDGYNDSYKTIKYHITKQPTDDSFTWKEFYDEDLFSEIKKRINYNHEPVVAVGYHPMILCYNDFNNVDGYIPLYPYADKLKFRRLIAPELEVNDKMRKYYDETGRKRYLFNTQIDFWSTRIRHEDDINLNINMDVLKNEYGGKFILSLAKISNKEELGLDFVGTFKSSQGVYYMNVYKVHS